MYMYKHHHVHVHVQGTTGIVFVCVCVCVQSECLAILECHEGIVLGRYRITRDTQVLIS